MFACQMLNHFYMGRDASVHLALYTVHKVIVALNTEGFHKETRKKYRNLKLTVTVYSLALGSINDFDPWYAR